MGDVLHTNEYTNKIRGCTGMATNVCERVTRKDAPPYEEFLTSMLLLCCTGAIPRNPNGAALSAPRSTVQHGHQDKVADEKFRKVWEGVVRMLENHRTDFSGSKNQDGRKPAQAEHGES